MENKIFKCEHCGIEYEDYNQDDIFEINSYELGREIQICACCYEDEVTVCQVCGEKVIDFSMLNSSDGYEEVCVCASCMENDNRIKYCEYDERYEFFEDDYSSYPIENYGTICRNAYEDSGYFGYCEHCGNYYQFDDMEWVDTECEEMLLCMSCAEEESANRMIKSYHSHNYDFISYNDDEDGDTVLTFGIELEVEKSNRSHTDREEMARLINEIDTDSVLGFENDGSLDYGFEIITTPMSLKYIDIHQEEMFKRMFELLEENKYQSYCRSTCGHHIHISKQQFNENALNLLNGIMEYFKEEFIVLSRRKEDYITRWCEFNTMIYDKEQLNLTPLLVERVKSRNRYRMLNLCNRNTIEIRIFQGTISWKEYMARLYMINNLCRFAIDNEYLYEEIFIDETIQLNELNFMDIILYNNENSEFILDYLEGRNLLEKISPQALAH